MAFYPGAGLDIAPIILFPYIKRWYYMDTQPCVDRPFFIQRLGKIMKQIGFECTRYHNTTLFFMEPNGKRTVTYYTNSVFPDDMYKHEIQASTLVACGFYFPNAPSLFYRQWKHVITDNKTNPSIIDKFVTENLTTIMWDGDYVEEDKTPQCIVEHARIFP
jgi:hypothetical protein